MGCQCAHYGNFVFRRDNRELFISHIDSLRRYSPKLIKKDIPKNKSHLGSSMKKYREFQNEKSISLCEKLLTFSHQNRFGMFKYDFLPFVNGWINDVYLKASQNYKDIHSYIGIG